MAADETAASTIVVFAPTVGAAPLAPVNEGEFGDVALSNKYFFEVAPELGKVAPVHDKST